MALVSQRWLKRWAANRRCRRVATLRVVAFAHVACECEASYLKTRELMFARADQSELLQELFRTTAKNVEHG